MEADFNYVIRLLKGYAPDRLTDLSYRHPEASDLLNAKGLALGAGTKSVERDAVETMLASVDKITSEAIADTFAKLRSNRKIELTGSILALVTSGGVVGSIIGLDEKFIAAGLGAIGFLSGLLTLFAKWQKSSISGNLSLEKSFDKLRDYNWTAREMSGKLDRIDTDEDFSKFVTDCNQIAKNIYLLLGNIGFEAKVSPL